MLIFNLAILLFIRTRHSWQSKKSKKFCNCVLQEFNCNFFLKIAFSKLFYCCFHSYVIRKNKSNTENNVIDHQYQYITQYLRSLLLFFLFSVRKKELRKLQYASLIKKEVYHFVIPCYTFTVEDRELFSKFHVLFLVLFNPDVTHTNMYDRTRASAHTHTSKYTHTHTPNVFEHLSASSRVVIRSTFPERFSVERSLLQNKSRSKPSQLSKPQTIK
jgi:hypothetical protein